MADIGVRFLGNFAVNTALAWVLAGGGIAYGIGQRRLRRNTVERMSQRTAELEERIDRKRTSSRLTKRGETNPGDRL